MGRTNPYLIPWYKEHISTSGSVALLGFTNNDWFEGDLYDLQLGNWDINSSWELDKKYDTIISLRCPYFAKDPEDFIVRCFDHLKPNGILYADWGLGDHWRFDKYKIGWVKDGEQEYAYEADNFLWSTVWDDTFLNHPHFKAFSQKVQRFGYNNNIKDHIFEEVPSVLRLEKIKTKFKIGYNMISLWDDAPQLYILLICERG